MGHLTRGETLEESVRLPQVKLFTSKENKLTAYWVTGGIDGWLVKSRRLDETIFETEETAEEETVDE